MRRLLPHITTGFVDLTPHLAKENKVGNLEELSDGQACQPCLLGTKLRAAHTRGINSWFLELPQEEHNS